MNAARRVHAAATFSMIAVVAAATAAPGPVAPPAPRGEVAAPALQGGPVRFEVGKPFPEIALPSLNDGALTSLAAFRGKKIILHVFASW